MRVLTGQAKGARLKSSRAASVRPTSSRVKNAIFATLPLDAIQGARVLDLYAGTGGLGIEALSRGAARVDLVERSGRLCLLIRQNLETIGARDRARVFNTTAQRALGLLSEPYDLVLLDPPYDAPGIPDLLARLGSSGLLKDGALVVLEHAWRTPPPPGTGRLALLETRRYGDTAVSYYRQAPTA